MAILSGCLKENLTDTMDITQFSWKVERIVEGAKAMKTPDEDFHGRPIADPDVYRLIFHSDSTFALALAINGGWSNYAIPANGLITIESFGTEEVCCNSDFDDAIVQNIKTVTSYKVLGDQLTLKGEGFKMELKQE